MKYHVSCKSSHTKYLSQQIQKFDNFFYYFKRINPHYLKNLSKKVKKYMAKHKEESWMINLKEVHKLYIDGEEVYL